MNVSPGQSITDVFLQWLHCTAAHSALALPGAYLVVVRPPVHGGLLVELMARAMALAHHAVVVAHGAHVHALVLPHAPAAGLHGVVRRVSLEGETRHSHKTSDIKPHREPTCT